MHIMLKTINWEKIVSGNVYDLQNVRSISLVYLWLSHRSPVNLDTSLTQFLGYFIENDSLCYVKTSSKIC